MDRASGTRAFALFASLGLMAIFAFGNLRTPAYVFFWLFGIVAIDTLATDILPAISGGIDSLICPGGDCPVAPSGG